MKLIIFLLASLFIFTGLIGFINSPNDLNINIKHNPYPVNVNNSVSYIREFPINLNKVPSGTGYYQQLITIGNTSYPYSNYNINSQGSNIQFISQKNSYLYAWVQNINTTTISVWVKNFNSSNLINMQVFPEFENLFSSTGYLGEAPQLSSSYAEYDNGKYVFNFYDNFAGTSLNTNIWTVPSGSNYAVDNGFIPEISVGSTTAVYNPSIQETNSIIVEWALNLSSTTYGPFATAFQLNRYSSNSNMYFLNQQGDATLINNGNPFITEPIASSGVQTFGIWNNGTTVDWLYNNNILYSNTSAISITDYLALGWAYNGQTYNFPTIYYVRTLDYVSSMPTFTIGTGYYFLNITSIYTNTNTSISNNYFWNGHITDIECYVLPELNNQPIIPLNYSGYITNSGLIYLNSSQFVNYHYNITFKYYSTVSPINYTFNQFYMPIFELGMIFLIGSVVYIEIRGYYKSMKER